MLEIDALCVSYGAVPALRGVDLSLSRGRCLALIGANGAGKSTLSLAVAGALRLDAGSIRFDGAALAGLPPERIARLGIALVPEGRHIFEGLTVAENLAVGMSAAASRREARGRLEACYARFPILAERRDGIATLLSGGEQQQLAIARALVAGPTLLVLDEPSLGLSPVMMNLVYDTLAELKREGTTLLLIEQNPERVGRIADEVAVLAGGTVERRGRPDEVLGAHAGLQRSYLGSDRS